MVAMVQSIEKLRAKGESLMLEMMEPDRDGLLYRRIPEVLVRAKVGVPANGSQEALVR